MIGKNMAPYRNYMGNIVIMMRPKMYVFFKAQMGRDKYQI